MLVGSAHFDLSLVGLLTSRHPVRGDIAIYSKLGYLYPNNGEHRAPAPPDPPEHTVGEAAVVLLADLGTYAPQNPHIRCRHSKHSGL